MSGYLIINILIILFPLLLSFETKIKYYRKFPEIVKSILATGIIFIIWDILAVKRRDWSFNKEYVSGLNIFSLPFEEVLFFITVPYSILFIYEVVRFYAEDRPVNISIHIILIASLVCAVIAVLNYERHYTFTVFIVFSSILFISYLIMPLFILSKNFLVTLVISLLPFFIVNYILTALPVVEYNPKAIMGIRILTIPVEDLFYSLSMISSWLLIYMLCEKTKPAIIMKND